MDALTEPANPIMPINREFLYYHRDANGAANEAQNNGQSGNLTNDMVNAIGDLSTKINELPIIVIDKRQKDENAQQKRQPIRITHGLDSFLRFPPINTDLKQDNNQNGSEHARLSNFTNFTNIRENLNKNFNANKSDYSGLGSMASSMAVNEGPSYLFKLMRSRSREITPNLPNRSYKTPLNRSQSTFCSSRTTIKSIESACELFDINEFMRRAAVNENKAYGLRYAPSFKDVITQATRNSNNVKNILISNMKPGHKSHKQDVLSKNDNARTRYWSNYSTTNDDSNPSKCFISPYKDNKQLEMVLRSRLLSNRFNNVTPSTSSSSTTSCNTNSFLTGLNRKFQKTIETWNVWFILLKNTFIILTLLLAVWPLAILVKFCWFVCKYLAIYFFPNLNDVCLAFDRIFVILLEWEKLFMDSISLIKSK